MRIYKKSFSKRSRQFKEWLKDYLKNSSIAGCAYYVTHGRRPKERNFWLTVHVSSVIFAVIMILEATIDFTNSPTVTTVETTSNAVQNVKFPGIAICDVNKINYSKTLEIAAEIINYHNDSNFTHHEITSMLKYLGHLYLFELNEGDEKIVNSLHKILTRQYDNYVPEILNKLRPSCQDIMEWCSWNGKEQACQSIFSTRKTGDGYCCTFNYARRSDDFGSQNDENQSLSTGEVKCPRATGRQYGLTIKLQSNIQDHYYKILPVLGYKILIFSPYDYPDAPSGSLREILVSPKTESSLTLQATTFDSVKEVLRYGVNKRNCLFRHEQSHKFGGNYSYSDCMMHCRISDILNFCKCVPFFYPTPISEGGVRICNLNDLQCLKTYRNRWWRVEPRVEESMKSSTEYSTNELHGALNCTDCRPACSDVGYEVSVSSAPLGTTAEVITTSRQFLGNRNHSIVNIFFKNAGTIKLKQDILFYWYELMSNYGGICSFFLGISLISVVEIFYFFTLRLCNPVNVKENKESFQFTFVNSENPTLRPLYWDEMIQPNARY